MLKTTSSDELWSEREILIAGLGSVGRRHLENLKALGWRRIRLYRTGRSTLPDDDLQSYPCDDDLDRALDRHPLAVIVSNPSALHMEVASAAARRGVNLLIEKPLSHDLSQVQELVFEVAQRQLTVLVGFQYRFHPGLRQIKHWIDEGALGRLVSLQAHWGEFLPSMHLWEDYRLGYAAREDLGGGVLLTLSHPFDYLRWLAGPVTDVKAIAAGTPVLGLGVDACAEVSLAFASGASGQVHLNFVQQPREHRMTVIGTEGTATWTESDHVARRFAAASGTWEAVPPPQGFERNSMFLEELRHFLACVRGEDTPACSLDDGIQALTVALDARRSAVESGAEVCHR